MRTIIDTCDKCGAKNASRRTLKVIFCGQAMQATTDLCSRCCGVHEDAMEAWLGSIRAFYPEKLKWRPRRYDE